MAAGPPQRDAAMRLAPGARLGPYEILAPLGVGGMGEVYKARDTRLDRAVAIKVLPAHLSQDAGRRARFEREARAIAGISHPHICALYDVGHEEGTDYLVMEFVEGETLAERLKQGALPVEQVIRHGIEVAGALDQAHRRGIVHRDLKPGNVMLTKSGIKLLDFGLAKLKEAPAPIGAPVDSAIATQHRLQTSVGMILGTVQYMAPEQLEGKEADARSDIFALGTVLYEMASGQRVFSGESHASVIAAVLSAEPPSISAIRPRVPPDLDRVIRTCLAKDPEDRWQTAHDVMLELKSFADPLSRVALPEPAAVRPRRREALAWFSAAASFIALLAILPAALRGWRRAAPEVALRFVVSPPAKTALSGSFAVSPDGRRLAFVASSEGRDRLFLRSLGSLNAEPLSGTQDASYPFWSPDSRFVGFFAQGKLKRIEVAGGPPQVICEAPAPRGGTWNKENVIVFAPSPRSGLHRVAAEGGTATPVTTLDRSRKESSHRWPCFLPDGRHLIYLVRAGAEKLALAVGSLDNDKASGESKTLVAADSNAVYSPPGYLLFLREGNLLAQPFDAERLKTTGQAVSIVEQVGHDPKTGGAVVSVSGNGLLAYRPGGAESTRLVRLDRQGKPTGFVGAAGLYGEPALSPDGRRVCAARVDAQTGNSDLWLLDLSRDFQSRLTFAPSDASYPIWSPDGNRIVFASDRDGPWDLYQKVATGAGDEEPLLKSAESKYPSDWSPDGRFILFATPGVKGKLDVWVLPLSGGGKPFPFVRSPSNQNQAQFSPDGRWVAYMSDESGTEEVYVQSFPPSGAKWQVSTSGGADPRWRRDGKELFYLSPDKKLVAVGLQAGSSGIEVGPQRTLFETRVTGLVDTRNHYVVGAGGREFLVNSVVDQGERPPIVVVVDWTADLKR